MPEKIKKARGFTLLEILVATVVLAVAFTGLFRFFGGTLGSIITAEKYSHAIVLAEQRMSEILLHDTFPRNIPTGKSSGNKDFSYKVAITKFGRKIGRVGKMDHLVIGVWPVTYNVSVAVEWREWGKTRSVKLDTLRTVLEEK